jgi:hypothetical protein
MGVFFSVSLSATENPFLLSFRYNFMHLMKKDAGEQLVPFSFLRTNENQGKPAKVLHYGSANRNLRVEIVH